MSSKHARLVAAVTDAMAAQGFTQKQVATMGGCTQGMLSQAINQGVTMKDERWRLICEGLGLDYDEIVSDLPAERERFTLREAPAAVHAEEHHASEPAENCGEKEEPAMEEPRSSADKDNLFLLAMYAEGRIAKDIEEGMKVDPMKLWGILDALKKIKDRVLMPE